jgi:hypothetical protein
MKVFIALVLPLLLLGSAIAFATVAPRGNNTPRRPVSARCEACALHGNIADNTFVIDARLRR